MKIVIIDDNKDICDLLKFKLAEEGYKHIYIYDNPILLIEDIKKGFYPSIIITDYQMPWLNGVELLQIVKELYPAVKSLIITADNKENILPFIDCMVINKDSFKFVSDVVSWVKAISPEILLSGK